MFPIKVCCILDYQNVRLLAGNFIPDITITNKTNFRSSGESLGRMLNFSARCCMSEAHKIRTPDRPGN